MMGMVDRLASLYERRSLERKSYEMLLSVGRVIPHDRKNVVDRVIGVDWNKMTATPSKTPRNLLQCMDNTVSSAKSINGSGKMCNELR